MSTAVRKIPTPAATPETIVAVNPATGERIGEVTKTRPQDIPAMMEKARQAQKVWAAYDFDERKRRLLKVRDELIRTAEHTAKVISDSTGKPLNDAVGAEVLGTIVGTDWYARKAKKYLKKKRLPPSNVMFANKATYLLRVPLGVVGVLSPWNYPFAIPFADIVTALMAGNAVLYKPAEDTAMVGPEIERLLKAAELPEGLAQFMIGDPAAIADAWFENGIDKVFFTGSVRVGKLLIRKASETLTPISLELGGNDAMIVLEDAPLERAVNGCVWAGFQNSGQTCAGVERVYVHEKIYDPFMALLKEKTEALRQGPDRGDFDIDVGSMTVARQKDVVERHVDDALAKGAKIHAQAKLRRVTGKKHNFYPATVLADCTHDMQVMREETFGPVVAVMKIKSETEALKLANDSDLGLTSSVWTMDNERGQRLAEKLETGITTINDHVYTFAQSEVPWVGWKKSGIGATHSHLGLEEMTKPKVVGYDLAPQIPFDLWWFPHMKLKYDVFLETMNLLFADNMSDRGESLARLAPRLMKDPLMKEKVVFQLSQWRRDTTRTLRGLIPLKRKE